ncbi:MAG: multicopper oxidase domain-containing protein [Chloroflexi bacterium]|nr:multicopper oxidase domain-containing protein [Chloroflexota bacterium]
MTTLAGNLIHRFSEHSPPAGARPSALVAFALALAYGGGLWLHVLHETMGATEHGAPLGVIHWLRDSTLMLPLVLAAVCAANLVVQRLLVACGRGVSPVLAGAVHTAAIALLTSAAVAAADPLHAALFEAHHHDAHDLPLVLHMARDGLLALVGYLAIAGAVAALLGSRAGGEAREPGSTKPRRPRRRPALSGLLALLLVSAILIPAGPPPWNGSAPALALGDPGNPCPAGSPVKQFEVQAIDVDIPLNRFGDHDPKGKMFVLGKNVQAVRDQEQGVGVWASRPGKVSIGLRDDPIQPLVVRANMGDCVEVLFTNNATGGDYGIHIDGLAVQVASSGDAVGHNPPSGVLQGQSRTYRYWVPNDVALEGAHYLRPGPGYRQAVVHGLFGALMVEPSGSIYLHPDTLEPIESGWEAVIVPGTGAAFREYAEIFHEVGDESDVILNARDNALPQVDPHTDAYRPGSRAMNYRSEPFLNRLERAPNQKAQGYGSYTFGDPATPMPRSYLADPTKIRILHAGSEVFHVYHLHGGGIRWRFNPHADTTYDYAATGLDKHPKTTSSPSARLDSQSFGPGEAYDLQIEGGAGGVQQAAGDFLFHCHIAHHYVSGMWSFWRVFNTRQSDLAPLPDRTPPPDAVDSADLVGRTMPDGTVITKQNLDDWIRPQLPPQGVPNSDQDASVWNWTVDRSSPNRPIYLGEPEDPGPWPNLPNLVPGHPGSMPGDQLAGDRPRILFNPLNGRIAYPLLRPHIGKRPPFSPYGHSGAPYLGEAGGQQPTSAVDPWAHRPDGLCPTGASLRRYNVITIQLPIQVTRKGGVDPDGTIYVLAKNKEAVLAGQKPAEPLAIRANSGDCVGLTLTNEESDNRVFGGFAKTNIHVHHVQFDVQASDGVITGLAYEQSVRPYRVEDPTLTVASKAGTPTLTLSNVAKFQPGVWIGIGLGTESIEVRQIKSIAEETATVTLTEPLANDHAAGEWAGTEFVQYRWYPDVLLDNVFFHDHVDGIHGWGHGLVGQIIVEPPGSTYHDPVTGEEVDSGTIVDIRTTSPLAAGLVEGSFRELALWTIDDNPVSDSTLNLRAEPWGDRGSGNDLSLRFSSYASGDPFTPLPRAYPGDPFVIRSINVGPNVDTLHIDGHRLFLENRYTHDGEVIASPLDTVHNGISERFTLILQGGAGGPNQKPGDYLYMNGLGRRFRDGAWGILRVLPGLVGNLQPLPGTTPPQSGATLPSQTGGRPPEPDDPGNPCPPGVPERNFAVSAVDLPSSSAGGGQDGRKAAFVPTADAAAVMSGAVFPEPLVLHAAANECVVVTLTNQRNNDRASFHLGGLLRDPESGGINIGFNPEQTAAPGQQRTYRFYADTRKIWSALISDFGGDDTGKDGLYGALGVHATGATFTDPVTGDPKDVGTQVDVHEPGTTGYRDFTLFLSDDDPNIGESHMPYPRKVSGPALVNYRTAPRPDDASAFSSAVHGDPPTPILRAYPGDPVTVHAFVAPGSEQMHVLGLGGHAWPIDIELPESQQLTSRGIGAWEVHSITIRGGAGGPARAAGDYYYGDLRRPFTQAGMWGLFRVLDDPSCPLKPLDGLSCPGQPATETPTAIATDTPTPTPTATATPTPTPTVTTTATPTATPTPKNNKRRKPGPADAPAVLIAPATATPTPEALQPDGSVATPEAVPTAAATEGPGAEAPTTNPVATPTAAATEGPGAEAPTTNPVATPTAMSTASEPAEQPVAPPAEPAGAPADPSATPTAAGVEPLSQLTPAPTPTPAAVDTGTPTEAAGATTQTAGGSG